MPLQNWGSPEPFFLREKKKKERSMVRVLSWVVALPCFAVSKKKKAKT